jgi:chromosome partitioning protein
MHTIAIANQKGGVGKTTTAVHLAAGLALQGQRVLIMDLDPQANASTWLGVEGGRSLYEWFGSGGEKPFVDVVEETAWSGLHIAPSSQWMHGIDQVIRDEVVPQIMIRKAIGQLPSDAYDFVVLDTAPGLGILTVNALAAADSLLVPVAAHVMSLAGLAQLQQTVGKVQEGLNPKLAGPKVLACRVDARTNHSREVQKALQSRFGRNCLKTYIRENIAVAESYSHAQPVFDYAPRSTSAEDYYAAAEEITATFTKKRKR